MEPLIGFTATLISIFALLERYGVPGPGTAFLYLLFGLLFVALGVATGKMLDATTLDLLLLKRWNLNLSLMVIGYAAMGAALVGWGRGLYRLFRPPAHRE